MKRAIRYLLTTTLAGFVLLFPVAILVFLIGKVLAALSGVNAQLAAAIPREKIGMIPVATLIGIFTLLLLLYMLGALVAPRRRSSSSWLERNFLNHVPGYSILRGTIFGAVGAQAGEGPQPGVLRRSPGVEELVLILDELGDGRSVVFLPNTPAPSAGKLLVVRSELVEPLETSVAALLKVHTDWGLGAAEVLGRPGS